MLAEAPILFDPPAVAEASRYRVRSGRSAALDGLRGLAILLMVADHVAAVVGGPAVWYRLTLGRAALPLFVVVAGMCSHRTWRRSLRSAARLVPVTIVGTVLMAYLGLGFPDVVAPIVLVLLVSPLVWRWPVFSTALGVVSVVSWPLGDWWGTYHPGEHLALFGLGVIAARRAHHPDDLLARYLPALLPLARIGVAPRMWYLGHLWALAVYVYLLGEPASASPLGPLETDADYSAGWLAGGNLTASLAAAFVAVLVTVGAVSYLGRMIRSAS